VGGANPLSRAGPWTAPALGPPTLEGADVLVSQPDGVTELTSSTGVVVRRMQVPGHRPDRDAAVARVGSLVATSGPAAVTVYG
jgi:hypothetical protein